MAEHEPISGDPATPQTYRAILTPIFGADALADAERRTYSYIDGDTQIDGNTEYVCSAGYCVLGVLAMHRGIGRSAVYDRHFPDPTELLNALHRRFGWAEYHPAILAAAEAIVAANDRGDLATPGALTALLDTQYRR